MDLQERMYKDDGKNFIINNFIHSTLQWIQLGLTDLWRWRGTGTWHGCEGWEIHSQFVGNP